MDTRTLLSKVVTAIYHTRLVDNLEHDDLIRTMLATVKTDTPEQNFLGNNAIKKFKDFCTSLLDEKESIPKETLLPTLSILLENDQKLLQVLKDSIEPERDEVTTKRIIANLIKTLNNYYKEYLAIEVISRASYDLKFNRGKIPNFSDYLKNTIAELEPLTNIVTSLKDPALVNEVDFENPDSVFSVFEEVKNLNNNKSIYKTGWQALNKMTQGGIRRGEFVTIGALQHKYKTGFSLSLFMQIATLNAPIVTPEEKDKKPLMLRISFEDSLTNNLQFMYQYLKAGDGETVNSKDFEDLDTKEMTKYILSKLTATGFNIKMMRVDPSQWTYSSVINKIIDLEAQGYALHTLMLDYVTLLPTTGCIQGPVGADKKDLVLRIRNFCSARNITFITPLQLSSEAKALIRNGTPEHQFVNEIAERGYYDGTKSIDQHIDCELYIHLFNHKRKKYLAVRRGKHRIPTVIAEEDKYFMLRFPGLNIPILEDVYTDDTSFTKLPKDSFDEGSSLLDEVLG